MEPPVFDATCHNLEKHFPVDDFGDSEGLLIISGQKYLPFVTPVHDLVHMQCENVCSNGIGFNGRDLDSNDVLASKMNRSIDEHLQTTSMGVWEFKDSDLSIGMAVSAKFPDDNK